MSRIFITGSSDGLGLLSAKALIANGHQVVLHARDEKRAAEALEKVSGAENILTGDLTDIQDTKTLAAKVNALGTFDTVIHNAGVFRASGETIFAVNTIAPYILTCLIEKPKRLIYVGSDMHEQGHAKLNSFRSGVSQITYSDSKLHVLMLCKAVDRKWPNVYANTIHPGWVPTKMGGQGAPDDLTKGYETQVWLAASEDEKAKVSGRYFHHKKEARYNPEADDAELQERFIDLCADITGVSLGDF
jgi:NAD(P)-dependent dehydrogenase (short-subunit alcohol dehydrogenase family)